MKILATVDFGKTQITQGWELQEGDPQPFLNVAPLEKGKSLMIRLNKTKIVDLAGAEVAEKHYPGTLKISDAIVVPSN